MPYVGTGLGFGGFVATIKDSFTGDGSATNFTLSRNATSAFDLEVFVGNVRQEPSVAYTVSGTTLAFTGTPANGEVIYVVHQAGALTTQLPSSFLGVRDYTIGGNLNLNVDNSSAIKFGADQEVTLTHVHNDGLLLNTDMQLQFRDNAINIRSDADGDLDINADDEIELNSTLIDINGNVEISGTTTQTGISTSTAKDVFNAGMSIKNGATGAGFIEFFEDSDNGTNKVTMVGPASTGDITLTLPSTAGTVATTASAADEATALAIALG